MIDLRPTQTDLVDRIRDAFRRHRRVLGVAPTGFGKTICFAYITTSAAAKGKRVYIIAHRAEIIEQISRALDAMGVRHGRIQPGHRMTDDLVQVAMVQTLARRLDKVPEPDLLVIDEAHHGVAGTWAAVTAAFPRARILGVTASPLRLDGRGLADAFDEMVLGPTMRELIRDGHLAPYTYLAPPMRANLDHIKTRLGDFAVDELAAEMDRAVITGDAIEHYRQHLGGRPAIAFCVTVAHAEHVAQQFREAGFRAASVDGAMERAQRRDLIAAIGDGRLQVLTSCELISEGVDVPVVAGAVLLRPTKSLAMFLQQVGRCLRLKPDGSAAVILDHVGNVHRHGMPDTVHPWSLQAKRKKKGEPAVQITTCETCFRAFAVYPGWRAEANCGGEEPRPVGCVLNAPANEKLPPEQVAGTLVQVTDESLWMRGIDPARAFGAEWQALLQMADTEEKLRQIARSRGFKRGWVQHVLRERAEFERRRQAEREEVPFEPVHEPLQVTRAVPTRWGAADPLDEVLGA